MRITFENNTQLNTDRVATTYSSTRTQETMSVGAYTADISGTVMDNNAYGVHGRTAEEVMQKAQTTDVATQRNYMAVMSNSMSTEDFSKMMEEGINPNDMEIETVVTIVDRIKAELAKSGVTVTGYNDDLDTETMTQIVGSESLARQISQTFSENDIPVTEENVEKTMSAIKDATGLGELSDGELKYLVTNEMEPTIENLYMAKHAGAVDANRQGKGYYQENFGYYAKKAENLEFDKLLPQVEGILQEAGLEVTEETIAEAKWLVEKGIPLTTENLNCLFENRQVQLPVTEEEALEVIAAAISNGKKPSSANLAKEDNKYQQAVSLSDTIEQLMKENGDAVKNRRILEEARLRMSAEVNVRLLESGFTIDTSDMEKLVDALKEAEKQQAVRMFPEESAEQSIEKLHLYEDTLEKRASLYQVPAAVLGKLMFETQVSVTVEHLADKGAELKNEYDKAGKAYETLMTAPRRDMGDSIKKAFANVDDILTDIGMEPNDETRRAIRILSYNQISLTPENVEQVLAADRKVQRVIDKMTPSNVFKMIRDGVNPLNTDMTELEQYFNDQSSEPEQEMETYSRYLRRLEKNHEISPDERDSYIGVYRMLRQIEKSDGAVIGSVLKAESDLNFRQLLTAARTAKKAGMNILVNDSFGGLTELHTVGISIDEQINQMVMQSQEMNDGETDAEEAEDELAQVRKAADLEDDVIRTLNTLDIPVTVNHMLAAASFTQDSNPLWKLVKDTSGKPKSQEKISTQHQAKREEITETAEDFDMAEASGKLMDALTDKATMTETYQKFSEDVTDLIKNNLYQPGQTSLDVKSMKSACMQMSIAMGMARQETYEIPVMFEEGMAAIRLTIQHGMKESGQAYISLNTDSGHKVKAFLQVKNAEVSGYVESCNQLGEKLSEMNQIVGQALQEKGLTLKEFRLTTTENISETSAWLSGQTKAEDQTEEKTATRTIYEASKAVIKALSNLL